MDQNVSENIFLDLLIEYTKAQMQVLEENPTLNAGDIYYKLKRTIRYLEDKKVTKKKYIL